jgi:SAM-dependent methyltransferase
LTLESPPCPLCNGGSFRLVYPGTIPETSEPGPYFGSFRTLNGYFPIVRCEACTLLQTRPRDDAETLAAAYANLPADDALELHDASMRMAEDQARAVLRHVPSRARVLDVGGGAGAFVEAIRRKDCRPSVLEPSAASVRLVRSRVPDVEAIEATIEDARIAPESYDAITLWDVIEHLIDPRAVVSTLRSWLVRGGHLFLQLPDSRSLVAKILGKRWPLLLREHLTYFDSMTVRRLLDEAGFDVLSVRPSLRFFPVGHLVRRLGLSRDGKASMLATRVVAAPAGEMRVVARSRG